MSTIRKIWKVKPDYWIPRFMLTIDDKDPSFDEFLQYTCDKLGMDEVDIYMKGGHTMVFPAEWGRRRDRFEKDCGDKSVS